MPILNIESPPDYINKFIHLNMEQLCNIYDEGVYNNHDTNICVWVIIYSLILIWNNYVIFMMREYIIWGGFNIK